MSVTLGDNGEGGASHMRWVMLASSPGHSQILSHSRGEKSGEGLGSKLRHRPEMVDSVCTNQVHHFRSVM